MRYLAVVERVYRGTVESQFFGALYGVLVLGEQLGGMDVVLRGNAVTAGLSVDEKPPRLVLGSLVLDQLPDHRETVRAMVGKGFAVTVDGPDLAALGLDAGSVLPGVQVRDTTELAADWVRYDGVWFL
jgi:hypothetical protein